jgi:hypothetical protein
MPVQWFTLRIIPAFPSVQYTGANADEVAEFVQEFAGPGRTTFRGGVLVVHMPDGDQIVKTGWMVSVLGSNLCVSSGRIRDTQWDQADPPS